MIDLKIGLDGVPSLRKLNIGNKYENNDEIINFILPNEFENYNKYIIAVIKQNGEKITKVIPIVDNVFYISSNITYIAGNWSMYLMCRENEVDIEAETIDISAKNGEHVFISDGFIGIVANSSIEKELFENAPVDTNLQLVYDDLLILKNELILQLHTMILLMCQKNSNQLHTIMTIDIIKKKKSIIALIMKFLIERHSIAN